MLMCSTFIGDIKRNKTKGTKHTAQNVANMLSKIVDSNLWNEPNELIDLIKTIGTKMIEADPIAFYIANIVKRVLHAIKVQ